MIHEIQEAVYKMDIPVIQKKLEHFLVQTISFYDTGDESFYHGLILGLCAVSDSRYRITSNRESGIGRFDIQMVPLNKKLPGILIELKAAKECKGKKLEGLAQIALNQINENLYDTELKMQGIEKIFKYGIAFSGKMVCVKASE